MKILSKKKWNDLQDLVVGLQQDLNYTREQLAISEEQVRYLLEQQKQKKRERKKKEAACEDGTKRETIQEK